MKLSELPLSLGEERKQRSSSRYIGVSTRNKGNSLWHVGLWDPQHRQHIGSFASEDDAARAYAQCGCAGTRTRCQAQLPRRGCQRPTCDNGRKEAAHQLPTECPNEWVT
jgi:hypothetical protein